MRIGISGGPGIGKTTLAKAIAGTLALPLIPEGVHEWLTGHRLDNPQTLTLNLQIDLQTNFLKYKMFLEKQLRDFVSDRTVIDGIVTTMIRIGKEKLKGELKLVLSQAAIHARTAYDVVFVPLFAYHGDHHPARPINLNERCAEHLLVIEYLKKSGINYLALEETDVQRSIAQVVKFLDLAH